jgi:FKBP-type peptidyl-prolyl cis-trans isomerase SlyD
LTNEALHRPIDALAVGEVALIAAIDRAGLDPGTAQRLCELGFDEGVDVEILHRAPFGGDPLAYLHGHGNLVPGLERQLQGKKAGDKLDAIVPAAEGYGEYDPQGDQTLPRSAFPPDVEIQEGMGFHTEDDKGNPIPLWVKAVDTKAKQITITSNHPLAGQRLNFTIEILSLRSATKEELSHGHVHGPGGHHH